MLRRRKYNYLYWSSRAVSELLDGKVRSRADVSLTIPSIMDSTPEVSWTPKERDISRSRLARRVNRELGRGILKNPVMGAEAQYIAGSGRVEFGEFVSPRGSPIGSLMFTRIRASDGTRTVVCLFGSMDNFSGHVLEAGPASRSGWTSSCAMFVREFLDGRCELEIRTWGIRLESRPMLAWYAYQIASGQGMGRESHSGRNRGYTYGDVQNSGEWLAEVYYDLTKEKVPNSDDDARRWLFGHNSFDRVVIGRPIWLRVRREKNVRLYSQTSPSENGGWPPPIGSKGRGGSG